MVTAHTGEEVLSFFWGNGAGNEGGRGPTWGEGTATGEGNRALAPDSKITRRNYMRLKVKKLDNIYTLDKGGRFVID